MHTLGTFGRKAYLAAAFSLLALGPGQLFGDDTAARARLIGAWQPQDPGNKDAGSWTFESKGADVMHVIYSVGDQKIVEFECGTTGQECKVKDSGKSAKVSMWFSGPSLVELETRGEEVVKRKFGVGDRGSLEVEVVPIQPDGKTEKIEFRRIKQ